jgi:hypothetical protein
MADESRSIPELLSNAITQVARLVRDEIQLARAEISTNISLAAVGIALLGASAVIMVAALVVLLLAFAAWLSQLGLSTPVSNLIAGALAAVISGVCAWLGLNRLRPENLAPKRTLEQLQRDASVIKEHAK